MKSRYLWVLIILLVALGVRLVTLGRNSVWLDEAYAVWSANRAPTQIWQEENDNHPPLYYLTLHHWIEFFGDSEAAIRLPSVIASLSGLALFAILARRLLDQESALIGTLLMALSPLDVWYAQEARMVIFVVPFALLMALGMVKRGLPGSLLKTVGLGAGIYFDYTIIPLWAILSGLWFSLWWQHGRDRRELALWFASSLAGWLAAFPLWTHLSAVIGRMSDIFVIQNIRDFLGLPKMGALLFFLLLIVLLGASTLVGLVLSRALERERPGRAMAIMALALFALATILAPLPRLYSIKRLLVTGWPFVILAVVYLPGGRFIWRRRAGIILVTLSLAATLLMITFVHKDDWRGAVNYINSHATSSDIVWLDPSAGRLPYEYYRPTITGMVSAEILPDPPAGTIWHIAERQPGKPVPSSSAESWLDEHGLLVLVEPTFNRLEVRQYEVARQE